MHQNYLELIISLEQKYSIIDNKNLQQNIQKDEEILNAVSNLRNSINLIKNEGNCTTIDIQKVLNLLFNVESLPFFKEKSSNIVLNEDKLTHYKFSIHEVIYDLQEFKKFVDEYISLFAEQTEIFFRNKNILILIFLGSGLLGSIIIANFLVFRITTPIEKLKDNIKILEQGDYHLDNKFEVLDNDEIGDIATGIERIGQTIKETVNFTYKIGKNEFDADLNVNRSGKLATALLSMRDNLKEITEQNEIQKQQEEKRNWIIKGLADLGNKLRSNTDEIENLYFNILKTICNYIGANQGGLFIIKERGNNKVLELITSFAYDRRKYLSKEIEMGEGLVGQCAFEKQITNITEIPNDYIEITSGLGNSNPNNLILVPLILNDEIYGVIELASFEIFDEHHIEYLEQSAESIASTISNMQINITTKALLEKTQIQAEEMAAQEEEMRQNMEELEATQEESQRKVEHFERLLKEAQKKNENLG
jgi:putative methionine-R-sulfoxide reductase with GAF domain